MTNSECGARSVVRRNPDQEFVMETATAIAVESLPVLHVLPAPRPRSPRQIEASRTNGGKGRGPVTRVGKQRSKLNAITHGLFVGAIPTAKFPIHYTPDEARTLAQDIARRYDCRDSYSQSLAESVAMDMLRLRQIKRLEHALLDPDVEGRRDIEQAMQQRRGHFLDSTPQDHKLLLDATTAALETLNSERRIRIGVGFELMVTDVWRTLSAPIENLARLRKDIAEPDDPEDVEWSKQRRAAMEQDLPEAEADVKKEGPEAHGVTDEMQVGAILRGGEIPPEFVSAWTTLMGRLQTWRQRRIHEIEEAERRIQQLQRELLLPTFKHLESLRLLSDYEQRVQRQMERTLAILKDAAGTARVIDVE